MRGEPKKGSGIRGDERNEERTDAPRQKLNKRETGLKNAEFRKGR